MKLFDADRWNEIWHTLARNRKRSIMTAFGVFWGVFMLVVLLGAGAGQMRTMAALAGGMSPNTCLMFTDRTALPYKGLPKGRVWELETADLKLLERTVPGILHTSAGNWGGQFDFSRKGRKASHALMGFTATYNNVVPMRIVHGRYINELDERERRKVCVIGTQVWKDLFPDGSDPVGHTVLAACMYFTVVGVQESIGKINMFSNPEETVVIPLPLCEQMFGRGRAIDFIGITAQDDRDIRIMEEDCKRVLKAAHTIAPEDAKAVSGVNFGREFDRVAKMMGGMSLLTWIVGLGTLLSGIVGISNIMLVTVRERTQEIGIRRAIGASPKAVLSQILSESFVLTFMAGTGGLTLAVALLSGVDSLQLLATGIEVNGEPVKEYISWQISFWTGLGCAGIIVAGSLLAGIIPAVRALKIKAVDAIREE